jgi:alpha-glucan, water dikinase
LQGERDETHGELVTGMGEALVGNHPGRALSFVAKAGQGSPQLLALPSKREALLAAKDMVTLIARSDSNGEDLQEFAGAGLYDSVPIVEFASVPVDYASSPLLWDAQFREGLLSSLADLGASVEGSFGAPQDIEGVSSGGKLYVVQSRPQILA